MIFDPVLDDKVELIPIKKHDSRAYWIWYPGQRVAHLHKQKLSESQKRFKYVGYPGSFRQPVYKAYFKKDIVLTESTSLSWSSLSGRLRMTINGDELDITDRLIDLDRGRYEIFVALDFTDTLPCFFLEGTSCCTDESWEVSVDKKSWVSATYLETYNTQTTTPLMKSETIGIVKPSHIEAHGQMIKGKQGWQCHGSGEIIVDFHYYELGEIIGTIKGSGKSRMVIGQSIEEVLEVNPGLLEQEQTPWVDISGTWQKLQSNHQAGRYGRLICEGDIEVKSLEFHTSLWPVAYMGAFECDDEAINQCWQMGAASLHSCMHEFYLDAIYRDALPWALDGVCALKASDKVFDDAQLAHQHLISQMLPVKSDVSDLGGVYLDFQLYTILGIEYNYLARKDQAFLLESKGILDHTLDIYNTLQDEQGFLSAKAFKGAHFFPDWAVDETNGPDCYGTPSYVQMLMMHCYEFGSFVAKLASDYKREKHYKQLAAQLKEMIVKEFYREDEGIFTNGITHLGEKDDRITIFSQVFAVLFDLIPKEDYTKLSMALKNNKIQRHKSISLNYFFELQALCKIGEVDEALASVKEHLYTIIKAGDVRVYEDINQSGQRTLDFYGRPYGKSLCHAIMGGAPVVMLSEYVLGIEPVLDEGFVYRFKLLPSVLKKISGRVPTPKGPIEVEIDGDVITLTIPREVKVLLDHCQTDEALACLDHAGTYRLRRN